jgi:hypothetical protein
VVAQEKFLLFVGRKRTKIPKFLASYLRSATITAPRQKYVLAVPDTDSVESGRHMMGISTNLQRRKTSSFDEVLTKIFCPHTD